MVQYQCSMLVVEDMAVSRAFYTGLLGLKVMEDLGANLTLEGGLALQTRESWRGFIGRDDIRYGGNDAELYFESTDFDGFLLVLEAREDITYVRPTFTQAWGQRVVRFYDPDRHIIEVGESMKTVISRFRAQGLTLEQTAERMDVPVAYLNPYWPENFS